MTEPAPPVAVEAATAAVATEGGGGGGGDEVDDVAVEKAQKLMDRILETQANPNPKLIHSLASLLESHEARYLKESNSLSNNGRGSHTIGKLANIIRDNDDFYELVFSKFLSENRCPVSISSAAARLLIICSSGWLFPHVFDDAVLDNIKKWVMDDVATSGGANESNWKHLGKNKPTDAELLRTYSVGLLAIALNGDGPLVEEILTLGVSAKLMHFLRVRVLGDATSSQKGNSTLPPAGVSVRVKDDARVKLRIGDQISDKITIPRLLGDANGDLLSSELTDSSPEMVGSRDISEENGDVTNNLGVLEGKGQLADDNSLRIRKVKNRGKGKAGEGVLGNERALMSPGSNRGFRDRSLGKGEEANKRNFDSKKSLGSVDSNVGSICGESNDERLRDCVIGSKDISEIVLRAIGAAESEARAAGAPYEAVKAAGDAAAELVKTAALEVWKKNNDEDAAWAAANEAASTVVDAAMSTDVSRSDQSNTGPDEPKPEDTSEDAALEDFTILDQEPLCQLREIYCIQCLEILGEYVEALGPILHEKGVDVCLALLQRTNKDQETVALLLPEVLKLINALGAHKKFAALFVDRGGIQKLLEVRRLPHTFLGLSLCLFTIGSLQGIMERVSALPPDVVNRVVELALQLLECQQDPARKNAAIFFVSAFVFRAILDSFDSKEGLQKFLNILQNTSVRSSGGNATPNPNPEVLTTSEKQIAYHTCVALRQYFRAHLLLLVDYLRPNKGTRGGARSGSGARAAYKPLDISSEAIDAVFVQIQKDRKLGTNLVRARWPVVDRFLALNGHITLLELCQANPVERYLHDMAQYAFGILHIVTFVPCTRKLIVTAQLSNNRVGMAVILDAAHAASYVDPEVIRPALNVLINLVCPPPSISNKPSAIPSSNNAPPVSLPTSDKSTSNPSNTNTSAVTSALVGDRRITLGSGAGCAGLAAQLEQGYRQAREAVRANNGIKVLLNLLNSRVIIPPGTVESIRALACRVLLGLAIDDTIAHILTKLQVGKKLSELIRDSTGQPSGGDQGRWQKELTNVAIELIAILTNSGKATTLAATDAAAPALRRIERAAIAAATPISYHSRELLQLIHEHLQASGLKSTADTLLKEADIPPLPSSGGGSGPPPPLHQTSLQEPPPLPIQWPSSRTNSSFLQDASKSVTPDDEITFKRSDSALKRKPLVFSSNTKSNAALKPPTESSSAAAPDSIADTEAQYKSPIVLPMKRKFNESKDSLSLTPTFTKRVATADLASYRSPLCQTPGSTRRPNDAPPIVSPTSLTLSGRANFNSIPVDNLDDVNYTPGIPGILTTGTATPSHLVPASTDMQPGNSDRMTLDSLVVQYLKHQHRQCPTPITTLPPLSLLQPHVCPEPSRALGAPTNVTARMTAREIKKQFNAAHCPRRDRQFIYSRFRPCRTCRDDDTLLTCMTFLGDSSRIATGNYSGELKIFDCNSGKIVESHSAHQTLVTLVQSADQYVLSSTQFEVRLWDAYSMSGGPLHSFDGCKAARFSHSGARFAALSVEQAQKEVLLYDVQTCYLELRLPDNGLASRGGGGGSGKNHAPSLIHFSPCDDMLLWNGVLWDRRSASAVHRFDQFTDYGGGGFHPAGNEVILNSEVWDLRKFKLLRSVPSLDQTVITFNGTGDVIYAILRRNLEDMSSAIQTRRVRHPLFPAFRTIDSSNYSEIATVQVDRCVLDLAVDPADSLVGVVAMDDHEEMFSSARLYEVGRRRAADDDSDPDDGGETEDEESDEEESDGDDINAMLDLAAADDSDDVLSESDNDEDIDLLDSDSENDDGEFNDVDDLDLGAAHDLLGMMADAGEEDGDDDDSDVVSISSDDEFDL